jgi:CubicO group peptidase (beta-lactamase class C family)
MLTKKSFYVVLSVIICNVAMSQPAAQNSFSFDSVISDFENTIRQELAHGGGFSVAIASKNKIVWAKAYGFSDQQTKELADSSTIYRIGSITKSFTAIVMMKLAEEGVIKLTDPIELYLPEIKDVKGYNNANKINFLQLATHTSGLERDPEAKDAGNGDFDKWDRKVLQAITATSIKSPPGKKFRYSNIGYAFLALALSRAAKQPFTSLVEQYIFNPLQMHNSFFVVPPGKAYQLAKRLRADSSGELVDDPPGEQHFSYGYLVPCGGIFSTAPDLLRFAIANMGFSVLVNTKDREMMQTSHVRMMPLARSTALRIVSVFLSNKKKVVLRTMLHDSYGIGFEIYRIKNRKITGHSGYIGSYSSSLYFEDASGYSMAILCNNKSRVMALDNSCIQVLSKLRKVQL